MAEALLAESVPATLESRRYCTNLLLLPTHPATGFPLAKLYDSSRLQKNENAPEKCGNCRVAEGSLKHSFFSRLRPTTSQCRRPQPQNDKITASTSGAPSPRVARGACPCHSRLGRPSMAMATEISLALVRGSASVLASLRRTAAECLS